MPAGKGPAAIAALARALRDPVATVRLGAAVSLVAAGVKGLPGEDGKRFVEARALYADRAQLNTDDSAQPFAAGRFSLLAGDPARASQALTNSLKLDPGTPARYYLAYALTQQAKFAEARAILNAIGSTDPQYGRAQELLKTIESR